MKTTRQVSLGEDISGLVSRGDGEQLEIVFLEMLASDVAVDLMCLVRSWKIALQLSQ